MKTLISEEYRAQNQTLHLERQTYGAGGHRWAKPVAVTMIKHGLNSVIDYGCGKGTLFLSLRPILAGNQHPIAAMYLYDPAVTGLMTVPPPAHLVVCTDVLEHIEPEFLDAVLAHMASLATARAFCVIATRPAKKTLPDGRNAHLIVESPSWWLGKLQEHFKLASSTYDAAKDELVVELTPK